MIEKKIAILGGGNIGKSIAEGVIKSGKVSAKNITVTKRNTATLSDLAEQGVTVHSDNLKAVRESNFIIIALKPYKVTEVLNQISEAIIPGVHTVVSVATGIPIITIQSNLPEGTTILRAMPNTAIAVQESMTCMAHNETVTNEEKQYVEDFFNEMGTAIYIQEELMEAATVLAASGIAYALRFIRANMQGGVEIGFNSELASLIATQTAKGAAQLLLKGGMHPEAEIDKVTTPMGITIAGLNEMEHLGFSSSLIKGITTSYNKIGK